MFQAGALSETVETCKCPCPNWPSFGFVFLARLLIKHQTHAKAQLDTRVPWQEVTHKAPLPNMPASPECDLYRNRESVHVWLIQSVCTCLWGAVETSQKGGGPCSGPGSSSSLAGHCQEATSSTHHWPGSPCPGWLQGRGSSGWPHRASWGGRWQLSWPGQSPGSLECSQTWPQCYSALGPRWRTVKNSESHKLSFFFFTFNNWVENWFDGGRYLFCYNQLLICYYLAIISCTASHQSPGTYRNNLKPPPKEQDIYWAITPAGTSRVLPLNFASFPSFFWSQCWQRNLISALFLFKSQAQQASCQK